MLKNYVMVKLWNKGNPYPIAVPESIIPFIARVKAKLGLATKVYVDNKHFKAPTEIYLAYCKRHKLYYLDYLHGFEPKQYLWCPLCLAEWKTKK